MTRKIFDCRDFPGPCSLAISGEEDDVITVQSAHLAAVHEMPETPQVRSYVRSMLKDESTGVALARSSDRP